MERISKLREELTWQNAAAVLAIYFVTLAFYRLFWHPLSRFPGPKLAAITRYYEAYFDVIHNGQYTFKIADLHKKYGKFRDFSHCAVVVVRPLATPNLTCFFVFLQGPSSASARTNFTS